VAIKIGPDDRAEVKVVVAREEAEGAASEAEAKTEDQTTGKA